MPRFINLTALKSHSNLEREFYINADNIILMHKIKDTDNTRITVSCGNNINNNTVTIDVEESMKQILLRL